MARRMTTMVCKSCGSRWLVSETAGWYESLCSRCGRSGVVDDKKYVWSMSCPDDDSIDKYFYVATRDECDKPEEEFREKRKLDKDTKVRFLRVVCAVPGCDIFAKKISINEYFEVEPTYRAKQSLIVDGSSVTCLCEKHHERLNENVLVRLLHLEDQMDNLIKLVHEECMKD